MRRKIPEFESIEQMSDATAEKLASVTGHMAFRLFQDKRFRELADFDRISQVEQDRIFNELVLAFLILIMLTLEAPDLEIEADFRKHLKDIQGKLPGAYLKTLEDVGVEAVHLKDWKRLIDMRYSEYARDRHDVRAAAMKLEAAENAMDLEDLSRIQLTLPVCTVAIGCHHHICRGKTDGRDELFKTVLNGLATFFLEIRTGFAGRRITPLMRLRAAARRFVRKILKRR